MVMWQAKSVLGYLLVVLMALGLALFSVLLNPGPVRAAPPQSDAPPGGPDRFTTMKVDISIYEWWLATWANNSVRCSFFVDHEGLPNESDIISACGQNTYDEWKATSTPCAEKDITACPGMYFILIGSKPSTRQVTVKLPPPQVWVSLEGCQPDENNWCTQQPLLVLKAEEPLPGESITSIDGTVGPDSFHCDGDHCAFNLAKTNPDGLRLSFWANSTYGDSSQSFDALIRVINDGGTAERLTDRWYVDVISSQWTGAPLASCSVVWESFPSPEGLPHWLTTPESVEGLYSNIPYAYLAANLITQGVVDVTSCPDGGLMSDGSANACGMEAAKPAVFEWQNRFDQLILSVSRQSKVPAQLLKNLFSRESQFWPGVFRNGVDVGLGQLTNGGADTALLWNPSFYGQFCPLVLDRSLCEQNGFANLKPAYQELLRGALVSSVDARCADCPLGLDLSRADFSVQVFARTLLANCEQAGKIVQDVSGKAPGQVADYETLWRLTLVNYNAGSGCLASAVQNAYQPNSEPPLTWERMVAAFDQTCSGAVPYVEAISRETEVTPAPTPGSP